MGSYAENAEQLLCMMCLAAALMQVDLRARLAARLEASPADFDAALQRLEARFGARSFVPEASLADLLPGTFYLDSIDEPYKRRYCRKA